MATENILEAFERLEDTLSRVERILCGDPRERTHGLLTEFEGLRRDVQGLRQDVQQLQLRRPNFLLWVSGYLSFLISGAFAMVGFYDHDHMRAVLSMPPHIALSLALFFVLVALVLFAAGFGWQYGRA